VLEYCTEEYKSIISQIANWRLETTENVLQALLLNRQEEIASKSAQFYAERADEKLMIFCLENQNEHFLKHALGQAIFGQNYFQEPDVQRCILDMLATKAKTELVLNTLIFADFSLWS